jgi:hypothetical protein
MPAFMIRRPAEGHEMRSKSSQRPTIQCHSADILMKLTKPPQSLYPGKTLVPARRACKASSRVGSSPTPTSVLPKLPPSSMALNAFGA